MNHLLEIDSVQLRFGERTILSDIYLKCETGSITGLLGRNGQGKSCLMKIIQGSLHCEKSTRFDKVAVVEAFKTKGLLAYLPQHNFIPASLLLCRVFRDFELAYALFKDQFPEFATKENTAMGNLSGGERRLVELYVIVKSVSLFAILDEPFTQLNPLQIEKVKALLVAEKQQKGLLISDHLHRHVVDVCDRLYVLSNGKTHLAKSISGLATYGYIKEP